MNAQTNIIYGPIHSRRLGLSLGISLTQFKTCNFDCLYCQWGKTTQWTSKRVAAPSGEEVIKALSLWIATHSKQAEELNYITLSGYGEPTLNKNLSVVIKKIREISKAKIAVITNSSLMSDSVIRKNLVLVDLVVPSLDAANQKIFERIDKPAPGIKIANVIDGLIAFRKIFKGELWLEVMILKGVNDSLVHIKELAHIIERIKPDKIQINSPVRAPGASGVECISSKQLAQIKKILGCAAEII